MSAFGTMALVNQHNKLGPIFHDHITLVGMNSYETGGKDIKTALQLLTGDSRTPFRVSGVDKNGYLFWYDFTNSKLKILYIDNNNAADGAAIEVPNTTDLSALTFEFVVDSK